MSTAQLSKQTKYSASWQAAEIANLIDRFVETKDMDCLYSARFELQGLIDYMRKVHGPDDPPF